MKAQPTEHILLFDQSNSKSFAVSHLQLAHARMQARYAHSRCMLVIEKTRKLIGTHLIIASHHLHFTPDAIQSPTQSPH